MKESKRTRGFTPPSKNSYLRHACDLFISSHKTLVGGFTLIELMVVVSIIGVLASFTLVTLNVSRGKARDIKRAVTTRDIITALENYHTVYGHYYCSGWQSSDSNPNFLQVLVNEGFLMGSPQDPINVYPYVYHYLSYKKTPGGACGQIVELNYDVEFGVSSCILGGKLVSPTHCHVLWPIPLPCPGNEYSENPFEPTCWLPLTDP